jgi:hypothetical protein
MDITREFLKNLITESVDSDNRKVLNEANLPESPSTEETMLSELIAAWFVKDTMNQELQGTGQARALEVKRAGDMLSQGLIDAGALKMVIELLNDVNKNLRDGDYAMQRES